MKYENGQKLFVKSTRQEVMVIGRTEFLEERQPRYCVQVEEGSIHGKNMAQDWVNEDALVTELPAEESAVLSEPETTAQAKAESGQVQPAKIAIPLTQGKKIRDMKMRDIKKADQGAA